MDEVGDSNRAEKEAEVKDAIRESINKGFSDIKCMPMNFIVLAEIIDEEGERYFWRIKSEDLHIWSEMGLIEMERRILDARITVDEINYRTQ